LGLRPKAIDLRFLPGKTNSHFTPGQSPGDKKSHRVTW
jgi:hypothetical protein